MSAQKLVFPSKYFANLGKIIIYQESFYIFRRNYGGYFKFAEKFMQRKEAKQTKYKMQNKQLNVKDTRKPREVAKKLKNSVTK